MSAGRELRIAIIIFALAALTLVGCATRVADSLQITVGPEFVIERGAPETVRQFPYLAVFGRDAFLALSHHFDAHIDYPADGMLVSRDGAATWTERFQGPRGFHLESAPIRLRDGRLFAMMYPAYVTADPLTAQVIRWLSADNGRSWQATSGTLRLQRAVKPLGKSNWCCFLFHRSMFEMPDGSLQGAMYGRYADDCHTCVWVKSTDGGLTWTIMSVITALEPKNNPKKYVGPGEPAVVRCADGSLLCVMRMQSFVPMIQCRSTDNGKTWSAPEPLPGVDPTLTQSVDPDLCLMKNGVLVLSYGRPGCRLLFSLDGCGRTWSHPTSIYIEKTTGYTGVREVAPGRLLVVGDTGHKFKTTDRFVQTIWGKHVDVRRSGQ